MIIYVLVLISIPILLCAIADYYNKDRLEYTNPVIFASAYLILHYVMLILAAFSDIPVRYILDQERITVYIIFTILCVINIIQRTSMREYFTFKFYCHRYFDGLAKRFDEKYSKQYDVDITIDEIKDEYNCMTSNKLKF